MKIHLVGDSIRLNAQQFVKRFLPPDYSVDAPAVNCKSSKTVAANIRNWVPATGVDVVHLNCGLHDIRYDPGQDQRVNSPRQYLDNLRAIFSYLAASGALVIWATSTPINESAHNRTKLSRRYQADLHEYNRLSIGLAREFGFHINDMYARLTAVDVDALLLPDGVHFNQAGNELVGKYIAEAIQKYVKLTTHADPAVIFGAGT